MILNYSLTGEKVKQLVFKDFVNLVIRKVFYSNKVTYHNRIVLRDFTYFATRHGKTECQC